MKSDFSQETKFARLSYSHIGIIELSMCGSIAIILDNYPTSLHAECSVSIAKGLFAQQL